MNSTFYDLHGDFDLPEETVSRADHDAATAAAYASGREKGRAIGAEKGRAEFWSTVQEVLTHRDIANDRAKIQQAAVWLAEHPEVGSETILKHVLPNGPSAALRNRQVPGLDFHG